MQDHVGIHQHGLETEAEGRLRPWGLLGVLGKGKVRQGKQLRMGWFEENLL